VKILIVDDEAEIRTVLRLILEAKGYEIIEATNGNSAIDMLKEHRDFDLCIMDVMMPKMLGTEATVKIREFSNIPILFLSAKSMDSDKENAYVAGGDDYLVKPFNSRELVMKVEALIRRYTTYSVKANDGENLIRIGKGVVINPAERTVEKNGKVVEMRDKEYEVLLYLARCRGKAATASEIYSEVWGELPLLTAGNTVTVHILNLRRKLEDTGAGSKLIRTVWGKGYQID